MRGVKPHIEIDRSALQDLPPSDWLSDDAKAEWHRTFPILAKRKILTEADLGSFENYCMAMGLAREMEREIQKLGAVQKVYKIDKDGNSLLVSVRKNPAVSVQSDAMTRARLLAAELGATPVSRSRPTVEDSEGDDDLFGWGAA
ncbi:phage terminase small subunit P27 family [Sinirhodobacter populi]|uniref:Phage terminase small subunit P27 family n=1 Tax=Paenirhodobacter populi TaxID=2306993 RepID=A0A443K9L5_9RHOB|nr:phage terminase small subunit P27 family [Sinirhodobacter populi]RWR29458.1 phage terminase small subunit P27 family [Sinirhodobacter populi]